jgi:signal transduction histidine kinase
MLVLAAGFTVLIIGTGLYVASVASERVTGEFDAALLAKARALVALTEDEGGDVELDYTPKHMPEYERSERPEYFQFWLADGTMLLRSRRLTEDLPRADPEALLEEPPIRDVQLPDGRAGRLVELTFVPGGSEDIGDEPDEDEAAAATSQPSFEPVTLVLVVARGREHLDQTLANMQLAIFGVGGIAILIAVLLVWRALALGFRPIESIASQVEQLDADSLSSRVKLPQTPREVAPVVEQLNALLERLDTSFERERRFADNVAHELRTPIAELRSLAAVGAKWPEDKASVAAFFEDVNDIAGRMEGVIADLLLLARCQAGVEQVVSSPTSLKKVITSTWSKLAPSASGTGLRFRMELPEDVVVASDPGKLGIVFANVLGNAVSYALPNSEIRCVGTRAGSKFQVDITNIADPLSSADLENLTEPFWRKDEARSSAEHAGLGLSLVSALARLLCLDVRFDQDRDGTFRVGLEGSALDRVSPAT